MSKSVITWVDITDLSSWHGHFTGTQRVTFEIAKRYRDDPEVNARFFVYDERSQQFFEASLDPVIARLAPAQPEAAEHSSPRRRFHRPSVRGVAVAQSIRVYNNLPFSIKQRITPERKELLRAVYKKGRAVTKAVRKPQSKFIRHAIKQSSAPLMFDSSDTVVILGKPWDTMTFIDVLRTQKLQNNFKVIHLIYDMIPMFLPHVFGKPLPTNYTNYMFEAISLSDLLLPISESSRRDVEAFCKAELLPVPKMQVIRIGDALDEAGTDLWPTQGVTAGNFILCVGTIEVRKNHVLLYTAYREAARRGLAMPKLVIVGGIGAYASDVINQFLNDPVIKDNVLIKHKVDDAELRWLYTNCRFTVYPSVYEGWGLPIAESLAYGKVCIASDTSSMTEMAGDLIDYFSPYDSSACLEAIQNLMNDAVLRRKETQIVRHYKPTSWDQTYQQVKSAS
jgi:glycosyltransferase involved in cell wall biosynthesis